MQKVNLEEKTKDNHICSYDEIMNFLDELESGELEKRSTPEDLERINHFLALLAKQGILPDESEEDLSDDIEELLHADSSHEYAFSLGDHEYMIIPAIFNSDAEMVLCKGWVQKKWEKTKKFVKKHKKTIIIGAAIVIATAVVVVAVVASSTAAATAASAAGAAGSASSSKSDASDKQEQKEEPPPVFNNVPPAITTLEDSTLKTAMEEEITFFKENIAKEGFFQPLDPLKQHQELSWEERGRVLESLLGRDLAQSIPEHLKLPQDRQKNYVFPDPKESSQINKMPDSFGDLAIDNKFSTNHDSFYKTGNKEVDFSAISCQLLGERALDLGLWEKAVDYFGRTIECTPANPLPYLERGVAHFSLGEYDHSLKDYHTYAQMQPASLSVPDFGLGFAKGLPKGVYDSGKGIFLLVSDLITSPIHTGKQIWDALVLLSDLARSEEWSKLSKILAPEMHQLIKEWDTLPSDVKGELAGYAFGKHGSDILIPANLAKAISKGVKGAQELGIVYRNFQTAERTLLLESVANLENGVKVAEVIQANQKIITLGEEIGLTPFEMGRLKQAGHLENVVANTLECFSKNPALRESFELFKKAKFFLKPYKEFMPEIQCRELIHKTGIQTFPRPTGIPENFKVRIAGKGGGIEYVHPTNTHIRIRVMPGKPHSPFPYQQKPYVIQKAEGKALDKLGNRISPDVPEAHIPLEEFIYRHK